MAQSTPSSSIKANFYGLALYETHLLLIKAKKTNLYEAKHWLPLRLFDLRKVPDGDGQLPYAIKMTYRDYTFEIGSLCHQEQDIWADSKFHYSHRTDYPCMSEEVGRRCIGRS